MRVWRIRERRKRIEWRLGGNGIEIVFVFVFLLKYGKAIVP